MLEKEKDKITSQSLHQYIKSELGKHKLENKTRDRKLLKTNGKSLVKEYDNAQIKINKNYSKLKEITAQFQLSYRVIVSKRNKSKYLENTFNDLILKYKHKEYKIPDLTTNHNLFKPSPLLLENNKINEYYQLREFEQKHISNEKKKEAEDNQSFKKSSTKHGEREKSKGYLTKLNKRIFNQKKKNNKSKLLLRKVSSIKELAVNTKNKDKIIFIRDKENEKNRDIRVLSKENKQLQKEIGVLYRDIQTFNTENDTLYQKSKKKLNYKDNSLQQGYTTFNSTKCTYINTNTNINNDQETKPVKAILKDNIKELHKIKTITSKHKFPFDKHSIHSRNYQSNLNIPVFYHQNCLTINDIKSKASDQHFNYTLSKEEFLKQVKDIDFTQLSLNKFEESIREYYSHYSDINEDVVKKYLLK